MRAPISAAALVLVAVPAFADGLTVTTPAFKDGGTIPLAQVCVRYHGDNQSPALSWSGEPAGTKSFAITMYDPDAPTGSGFWHWTVFNIPASVHDLPAGAGDANSTLLPEGAGQGRNDAGISHYSGPCPPAGDPPHHYQITVFAVKVDKLPVDAILGRKCRLQPAFQYVGQGTGDRALRRAKMMVSRPRCNPPCRAGAHVPTVGAGATLDGRRRTIGGFAWPSSGSARPRIR